MRLSYGRGFILWNVRNVGLLEGVMKEICEILDVEHLSVVAVPMINNRNLDPKLCKTETLEALYERGVREVRIISLEEFAMVDDVLVAMIMAHELGVVIEVEE